MPVGLLYLYLIRLTRWRGNKRWCSSMQNGDFRDKQNHSGKGGNRIDSRPRRGLSSIQRYIFGSSKLQLDMIHSGADTALCDLGIALLAAPGCGRSLPRSSKRFTATRLPCNLAP